MVDPKQNDPAPSGDPLRGADEVRSVEQAAHLTGATGNDTGTTGEASTIDHAERLESEHEAHTIAGAIYGTILATTVVASLGYNPEKLEKSIAIVLFTSLVFWAAHVYALTVAGRMVVRRRLTRAEMSGIARNEWPMLQSSLPVVLPLLLGVVGIISRENAADIAMLVGIGALFVYGVVLGLREGRGSLSVFWNALVVGSFGVLILLLKIVVH